MSLLILHGFLGSSRNWNGIAGTLRQRDEVFLLDLPNHGTATWTETMDYPFLAETVSNFIRTEIGPRTTVLGHSMGGKVAMTLALTHPEQVERLIVGDIAPVRYTHTLAPYIKAMRAVVLSQAENRKAVERALEPSIPDPRIRAFLLQNLEGSPGTYRWRANLAVLGAAMEDILGFPSFPASARYDGPSLFLTGAESEHVLPEHHAAIFSLFPAARLVEIKQAGHWLHADQPTAFVQAVSDFTHPTSSPTPP